MAWCADGLCPQLWTAAAAEAAAKRVVGVVGVANDIEVHLPARDAVGLRHDLPDAADASQVVVKDGWVNLLRLANARGLARPLLLSGKRQVFHTTRLRVHRLRVEGHEL
jgi:hypothetical protein